MDSGPSETATTLLERFLGQHRTDVTTVAIYATTIGVLVLATPIAVQALVSTAAFGTVLQPIFVIALLLLAGLVLAGGLRALKALTVELLQQRAFARTTDQLVDRIAGHGTQALGPHPAHRFFYLFIVQKAAATLLLGGIDVLIATTVGMTVLAFYHPLLLAFDAALVIAVLALIFFIGRGGVATALGESSAKLALGDVIARLTAAAGARDHEARQAIEACAGAYLRARNTHFRVVMRQLAGGLGLQALASAGLLGLGGWLVVARELTLGQLVAAELIVTAVLASLSNFGKYAEHFYDLVAGLHKLHGLTGPVPREDERRPSHAHPAQGTSSLLAQVPRSRRAGTVARTVAALLLALALLAGLAPWQQSLSGAGRVVAYAPVERRQVVEAPVSGRVVRWLVQEGARVRAGEPLVELSDNDPDVLTRLQREHAAASLKLRSYEERERALTLGVESARAARRSELAAAAAKLDAAESKVQSSVQKQVGTAAALTTARLNGARASALTSKGLSARRELEQAELALAKAQSDDDGARADVRAAESERSAARALLEKARNEGDAKVQDAEAKLGSGRSDAADARASLTRLEGTMARQHNQLVRAPRDALVLAVVATPGGDQVKPGDMLALLVPDTESKAVELYVDGNDAALVSEGRKVRLQFEGWPAVQFSGWPSVAVGTFGGVVSYVDSHADGRGNFRVVVQPDPASEAWPSSRFLRQGARTKGWILLEEVRLGFELWRRFNGFPPSLEVGAYEDRGVVSTGKEGT